MVFGVETSSPTEILSTMKGELVWQVRSGVDQVLRMDFGISHLRIREPNSKQHGRSQAVIDAVERRLVIPTGKWHLFVLEADWSISTTSYTCCRSDTNIQNVNKTLLQLDGQRLTDACQTADLAWTLKFDLGASLNLSAPETFGKSLSDDEIIWTLFYENGDYLSCSTVGKIIPKPI